MEGAGPPALKAFSKCALEVEKSRTQSAVRASGAGKRDSLGQGTQLGFEPVRGALQQEPMPGLHVQLRDQRLATVAGMAAIPQYSPPKTITYPFGSHTSNSQSLYGCCFSFILMNDSPLHLLVQGVHSPHPEIRIPQAFGTQRREVGLPVVGETGAA